MSRVTINVATLEFDEGGHTLWVHNEQGLTVLRVRLPPGVTFESFRECENVCSHCDITAMEAVTLQERPVVPFCLVNADLPPEQP